MPGCAWVIEAVTLEIRRQRHFGEMKRVLSSVSAHRAVLFNLSAFTDSIWTHPSTQGDVQEWREALKNEKVWTRGTKEWMALRFWSDQSRPKQNGPGLSRVGSTMHMTTCERRPAAAASAALLGQCQSPGECTAFATDPERAFTSNHPSFFLVKLSGHRDGGQGQFDPNQSLRAKK